MQNVGAENPALNAFASRRAPLALAFLLASAAVASGQHTQTVLFGEANARGVAHPRERRAVHPITAPYYHEDAFVTTDLRAWYLNHQFPNNSPIGGGDAKVYALQIRAALTESLQFVAYKDGYAQFDSGAVDDSGWNDVAAGLKWAFVQDWERDFHAAAGLGYELPVGSEDVLQDDAELRVWAGANKGFDRLHLGFVVNGLFATGSEDDLGDSDRLSWHLHADYFVNEWVSPVVEVNGYMTLNEGDNTPLPFSGVDVANLGGGDGEDVISAALGGEIRPCEGLGLRAAYEAPLTDNEDLFGYRWTISAVWGF